MPHPPFPPRPPHHPPYPYDGRLWYTDVEPAYEKPAGCECHFPPIPNNCVCVTEEDVNNWNAAYDTLYDIISAGIPISALTSAAQMMVSATYWNQAYNTVSSNSAYWNQLSAVSAANIENGKDIRDLSAKVGSAKTYTEWPIIGEGSLVDPIRLVDSAFSGYAEDYEELREQIDELRINMQICENTVVPSIHELSGGHIQNFEMIMQLMGKLPASGGCPFVWVSAGDMNQTDINSYRQKDTLNWMYYKAYEGDR